MGQIGRKRADLILAGNSPSLVPANKATFRYSRDRHRYLRTPDKGAKSGPSLVYILVTDSPRCSVSAREARATQAIVVSQNRARQKNMKSLLSALCTLLLLQAAAAAETHGDEGGAEETVTKTVSPCGIPLEDLYSAIEGIFGQNYTVYINCLSFDETGSLERGVVSGTHPTEADQRFVLECQTGILVAICSTLPANEMDIRDNYAACSMCVDSLVSMEICVNREYNTALVMCVCSS